MDFTGKDHTSKAEVNATLRPKQNSRHFAAESFRRIFFDDSCCILIRISLKYIPKGPINNNSALV